MPMVGVFGPEDFSHRVRGRATRPVTREARALPTPELEWTPEIERETAHLYARVKAVIPPVEWPLMAPYVSAINKLITRRAKTKPEALKAG